MSTSVRITADERHRAHHTRPATRVAGLCASRPLLSVALVLAAAAIGGCSGSLPRPPAAQVGADDYVAVPFPPRTPPVEFIPPSPAKGAVWADGTWEWLGDRYVWRFGSWVIPPPGARRARWVVVRRPEDGQLFFAASSWRDAEGKKIDDRPWATALGPRARARSRPGASAPARTMPDAVVSPAPDPQAP